MTQFYFRSVSPERIMRIILFSPINVVNFNVFRQKNYAEQPQWYL